MSPLACLRRGASAAFLAAVVSTLSVRPAAAQAAAPALACAEDADYRQLDFLIGDWEVFRPDGKKHADAHLAPALDGCVVTFTWQPLEEGAQHGAGFFTYSRLRKSLMFLYAGNKGSETAALRSQGKAGDLGLFVEYPNPHGRGTEVRRMGLTLMADGSIHETQQVSDNGGPFKLTFEAFWRKKDDMDTGDRP
ncbi:MAG: hypothetical protein QM601_00345 [Pseudoxanthomonas sp.]